MQRISCAELHVITHVRSPWACSVLFFSEARLLPLLSLTRAMSRMFILFTSKFLKYCVVVEAKQGTEAMAASALVDRHRVQLIALAVGAVDADASVRSMQMRSMQVCCPGGGGGRR